MCIDHKKSTPNMSYLLQLCLLLLRKKIRFAAQVHFFSILWKLLIKVLIFFLLNTTMRLFSFFFIGSTTYMILMRGIQCFKFCSGQKCPIEDKSIHIYIFFYNFYGLFMLFARFRFFRNSFNLFKIGYS